MPSTAPECTLVDKIDRKKKRKKLQTDESQEVQPGTDSKKIKKERLKSKEERSSGLSVSLANDQIEQISPNQTLPFDESNQQSPLLVDEQSAVLVKKKKKRKKVTSAESRSPSICQDGGDCENASAESPVVLENIELEKKKKRKKKLKEGDNNEERNDNNNEDEVCHDKVTKTKSKKKKKSTKNEEEHLEPVGSNSNLHDEKFECEGDSLSLESPCTTAIVSVDKEETEKKKKKKHKLKHKEQKELLSSDHIASEKHENNVAEGDGECDTTVHKIKKKKKKKRKREEQEGDEVCSVEEQQEENVKNKSSKKKKKTENDDRNSVDNDDSQLPYSHATPQSKLFKNAVFESAERESQFSRVTGKPANVEDYKKNKVDSSSQDNNNIEEKSSSPLVTGQWQGALFENKERQSKFLRLLGGMKSTKGDKNNLFSSPNSSLKKKGLYGSLSASVPNLNSSSGNTPNTKGGKAMSVSDAAEIDKKLEEDYNKAMNFRLSGTKGAGLGFAPDPAEGKKFHIDANSTKSLKFDNDDD